VRKRCRADALPMLGTAAAAPLEAKAALPHAERNKWGESGRGMCYHSSPARSRVCGGSLSAPKMVLQSDGMAPV
jgi:hypothetical protein